MRNSKNNSNKEVRLNNELITLNKHFKPFEAKILYGLLSIYTYEVRRNSNFSREFKVDNVDVKKMMLGGSANISFGRYKKKILSMETGLILYCDDKKEEFESIQMITGIKVNKNETTFVLNYDVCKMANELGKNWGVIKLLELAKLNSSFSIKAYELCTAYKGLEFYHMPIDKFKSYFNISSGYATRDISRGIIEPIIRDINDLTEFNLKIKKCKDANDGVTITHYDFYISVKSESETLSSSLSTIPSVAAITSNSTVTDVTDILSTSTVPESKQWFSKLWDKYPKKEGFNNISNLMINKLYADKENVEKAITNYLKDKDLKINGGWKEVKNGKTFFDTYEDYINTVNNRSSLNFAN